MPRVTSKGQVTIPRHVRDKFSIHPGSHIEFIVKDNEVKIIKSNTGHNFTRWLGKGSKKRKKDIDAMINDLRGRSDG